jgi:hypothetical protein
VRSIRSPTACIVLFRPPLYSGPPATKSVQSGLRQARQRQARQRLSGQYGERARVPSWRKREREEDGGCVPHPLREHVQLHFSGTLRRGGGGKEREEGRGHHRGWLVVLSEQRSEGSGGQVVRWPHHRRRPSLDLPEPDSAPLLQRDDDRSSFDRTPSWNQGRRRLQRLRPPRSAPCRRLGPAREEQL